MNKRSGDGGLPADMTAGEVLDAVIQSSFDGIFVTDNNGIVLYMNAACERLEEISSEKLIGRRMEDLVREGIYSDSVSLRVIKEKAPITIIQKTRTGKEIMVTGSPYMKNGQLKLVITNERDITDLNRLKRQVREKGQIAEKFAEELKLLRAKNTGVDGFVSKSKAMCDLMQVAVKIAQVDTTVLIQGETGVGKEVLAKIIYRNGSRKSKPFIDVNCGAIPENLLESELFGYEEGAFTGARKGGKQGLLEIANGGILFLDEIGDLPLNLQVKLLRFLQERKIVRVGGVKEIDIDVRIIAATNKNLQDAVERGEFRSDLFYRLSVVPIFVPSLRQRKDDIEPLMQFFLVKFNEQYNMNKSISPGAVRLLINYEWPGNVRELENMVERLLVTCPEDVIEPGHLGSHLIESQKLDLDLERMGISTLKEATEKFEKEFLVQMLKNFHTISDLARALGVDRSTIVRKIKKYRLGNKILLADE